MLYSEICNIKREGTCGVLEMSDNLTGEENVELQYDGEKLCIKEVSKESPDMIVCSSFGLYEGIETVVDILLLDKEQFLIIPRQGAIVVELGDVVTESGESAIGILDVNTGLKVIKRNKIVWRTPQDILDVIGATAKMGLVETKWGKLLDKHSFDHIYVVSFKVTNAEGNGISMKPVTAVDISCGEIDKKLQHMEDRTRERELANLKRMVDSSFQQQEEVIEGDDEVEDGEWSDEDILDWLD